MTTTNYIPTTASIPVRPRGVTDRQIVAAIDALGIDITNIRSVTIGFEGVEVIRNIPGRLDSRTVDLLPILEG